MLSILSACDAVMLLRPKESSTYQHKSARKTVLCPGSSHPGRPGHMTRSAVQQWWWGAGWPRLCAWKPSSAVAAAPSCGSRRWDLSGCLDERLQLRPECDQLQLHCVSVHRRDTVSSCSSCCQEARFAREGLTQHAVLNSYAHLELQHCCLVGGKLCYTEQGGAA